MLHYDEHSETSERELPTVMAEHERPVVSLTDLSGDVLLLHRRIEMRQGKQTRIRDGCNLAAGARREMRRYRQRIG